MAGVRGYNLGGEIAMAVNTGEYDLIIGDG